MIIWLLISKKGFIDRTGKLIIPPQYGSADKFSHGLAMIGVENGGDYTTWDTKYGYIDKTGKMIWQPSNLEHGTTKRPPNKNLPAYL